MPSKIFFDNLIWFPAVKTVTLQSPFKLLSIVFYLKFASLVLLKRARLGILHLISEKHAKGCGKGALSSCALKQQTIQTFFSFDASTCWLGGLQLQYHQVRIGGPGCMYLMLNVKCLASGVVPA